MTLPRQLAVPEPVALTREPELALAVCLCVLQQPVGQPSPFKGAYGPLLDEARAGPLLDELATFRFQQYAVDGGGTQDVGDCETGRSGPDDDDAGMLYRRGGRR